jgi:hypothetical protein
MAKQSGIGAWLLAGAYDLSSDVGAVSNIETTQAQQEVPSIQDAAMARLGLRRDGAMSIASFWDTSAGQSHPVLSALPRTDVIGSYLLGSTVANPAASINAKQNDYAVAYGEDGSLGIVVGFSGSGFGLEWSGGGTGDGMLTTGLQSFATGTVSGTSIDLGATSTLFGAAGYLHVTTMPSGTATFAIQDSPDNVTFTDVTGLVFTALTGPGSERKQTAAGATIARYVRLQGRGTHGTSLVACNFIRYLA